MRVRLAVAAHIRVPEFRIPPRTGADSLSGDETRSGKTSFNSGMRHATHSHRLASLATTTREIELHSCDYTTRFETRKSETPHTGRRAPIPACRTLPRCRQPHAHAKRAPGFAQHPVPAPDGSAQISYTIPRHGGTESQRSHGCHEPH